MAVQAVMKEKTSKEGETASSSATFKAFYDGSVISKGTFEFVTDVMHFETLSPVQEAVIPLFLLHKRDVAVEACTGSGKSLAFLIPCVEILFAKYTDICIEEQITYCSVGALCLAPTRELAQQMFSVLRLYLDTVNNSKTKASGGCGFLSAVVLTGGCSIAKDVARITSSSVGDRKSQLLSPVDARSTIVVATPGRLSHLLDHLTLERDWSFKNLEVLIFDEADQLLLDRASFQMQISRILDILPKQRRTGLFSATLSSDMQALIKSGMRNPVLIRITVPGVQAPPAKCGFPKMQEAFNNGDHTSLSPEHDGASECQSGRFQHALPQGLRNLFLRVKREDKFCALLKFLLAEILPDPSKDGRSGKKCIIFFLTCAQVTYFYKLLSVFQDAWKQRCFGKAQLPTIVRLSGKMPQKSREAAYRKFTVCSETNGAILLATDVAARGLDFSDVSWIIQYDAPVDPSMFVHRIGRTARAGRDGKSLLLLCPAEDACLPFFSNRNVPLRNLLDDPGAWRTLYLGPSLIEGVNVWAHEHPQLLTQEFPHSATFEGDRQGKVLSSQDVEDAVKLPASDLQWSWAFCRTALLSDRDVLLKAAAAFVSFLRAYKEHQLQYIFPFSDLEIGALATSMALLRLPRVKEILGKKIEGFQQSSVHPKTVTFKDLNRQAEWEATKKGDTAKLEKEKKEACAARDKCATRFVNGPKPRTQMNVKRTGTTQRRAKKQRVLDEWENLQLEERLAKKLRTGKLSVQEYERLLRGQDGTLDDRSTEIFESGTDTGENGVADANLHGSALQATKPPRWVKRGKRGGKKK